jgi:uncharacterized phage protein (TIGR01671 family)
MSVIQIWFRDKGDVAHIYGDVLSGPSQTWWRGDFELMQFTGLKDKNGTEIYEGDILKRKQGKQTFRNEVVFTGGGFGIAFQTGSAFLSQLTLGIGEVVGNIYENADLLR